MKAFLAIAAILLSVGCSEQSMVTFYAAISSAPTKITGNATMFIPSESQSTQATCSAGSVTLHSLNSDGTIDSAALASATVDAKGDFQLEVKRDIGRNIKPGLVQFVIKATGCDSVYFRPVTDTQKQNITTASTLITMATVEINSTSKKTLNSLNTSDVSSAIDKLSASADSISLSTSLNTIISDQDLKDVFESLTRVPPVKVKETPPTGTIAAQSSMDEESTGLFSVVTHHWNPDYEEAVQWELDGQVVSTTNSFSYTPGKNAQGSKVLWLKLGSKDGDGALDTAKSIKTEKIQFDVKDTFPAVAPALSLISASITTNRTINLSVNTGAALINCSTFSNFTLSEDIVAPTEFPYDCDTENSQNVSLLVSSGDGVKSLYIWVQDASGKTSASLVPVLVTLDTTNPSVSINPTPATINNLSEINIQFSGSDSSGIASYQCKLDSGSYENCTSPKTYSSLSAGSHSFSVRATDLAGNTSNVASSTWTTDLTAPNLTINTHPSSITNQTTSHFTFSATDSGGGSVAGYQCQLNGASYTTCTSPFSTTLTQGAHTFYVRALDSAGNISSAQSYAYVIDTTAPTTTISAKPNTYANSANATFSFLATDLGGGAISSYECSLDNGAFSPCSSSTSYSSLTEGEHVFSVRATDTAGNTGVVATSIWNIDLVAPVLTSLSVNGGSSVALSPVLTVVVNATDSRSGVAAVRFADALSNNCQSAYANTGWQPFVNNGGNQTYNYTTGFVNGNHLVCAWAKDSAGNVNLISENSGAGTLGVNTASIRLDQGSPPSFSALSVTNDNSSSIYYGTTTFAANDDIKITFTITDDSALDTYPISVLVTTNGTDYSEVVTNTDMGSPGTAQTTWTKTYTSYKAPTNGYFRLRLVATDANGNTSQTLSPSLNTLKWSVFAGNDDIGNGSSALSSRLRFRSADIAKNQVAVNKLNEIFVATLDGIRKISPNTGNIDAYLRYGTETGIPGVISSTTRLAGDASNDGEMVADGNDLYIRAGKKIYLVDTVTNQIKVFAGGGSTVTTLSDLMIWNNGAITIDPVSKDIYFSNTCDPTVTGSSSTVSVKVQKITQNTTTKTPTGLYEIAGNCVKGTAVNDSIATNTPLESGTYRSNSGSLVYVPSTQALYYAPNDQRMVKILNGRLYRSSNSPVAYRGGVYSPKDDKVYYAEHSSGIISFTPTSSLAFDEVATTYVKSESLCNTGACREDGVDLNSAGVFTTSLFLINGGIGLVDNTFNTSSVGRIRVVDSATNSIQTLAGTDRFTGNNGNRTLARFAEISSLIYKTSSVSGFEPGLYALDRGASRLLYMDLGNEFVTTKAGTGVSRNATAGSTFGTGMHLGSVAQGGSGLLIMENILGYFTFGNFSVHNVNSSGIVENYLAGGGSYLTAPEGTTSNAYQNPGHEIWHGMVTDSAGNLYFGGYFSGASGYNRIKVRRTNGALYTVIGTNTIATSSNCSVAGCASTLSILGNSHTRGANGNYIGPYDNRYNANEGRLLFAEGNKIRYVTRAYDPTQSKYGTLIKEGSTEINFGRPVGAFVYTYVDGSSEQIDKLYYVSDDKKLYCYKVSSGTDTSCNNATTLGPNSPLTGLANGIIAMDPNGNIYIPSQNNNLIYKFTP